MIHIMGSQNPDRNENSFFPEDKYRRASEDITELIMETILSNKFKED